jgi:hypothetical protein
MLQELGYVLFEPHVLPRILLKKGYYCKARSNVSVLVCEIWYRSASSGASAENFT